MVTMVTTFLCICRLVTHETTIVFLYMATTAPTKRAVYVQARLPAAHRRRAQLYERSEGARQWPECCTVALASYGFGEAVPDFNREPDNSIASSPGSFFSITNVCRFFKVGGNCGVCRDVVLFGLLRSTEQTFWRVGFLI